MDGLAFRLLTRRVRHVNPSNPKFLNMREVVTTLSKDFARQAFCKSNRISISETELPCLTYGVQPSVFKITLTRHFVQATRLRPQLRHPVEGRGESFVIVLPKVSPIPAFAGMTACVLMER